MKDAIKLSHRGHETTFAALSKLSGVCIATLHSRWRQAGRPTESQKEIENQGVAVDERQMGCSDALQAVLYGELRSVTPWSLPISDTEENRSWPGNLGRLPGV